MFIKGFEQLSKNDIAIAGGKGASLGEMTISGIPVPPGFVLLSNAFEHFLEKTGLNIEVKAILDKLNPNEIESVERSSSIIQELIIDAEFPKDMVNEIKKEFKKLDSEYVAVRSSATAEDSKTTSWAGELESYLNTTKVNLLENIKKCWASLFTPRAIFYRFDNKLHKTKVSVAVIVQKMIQSEISGICFTVHPVTKDKNKMIIEAGYGLGEAIVGGKITPDSYIIYREDWTISERNIFDQQIMIVKEKNKNIEKQVPVNIKEKQKLSDKEIIKLAQICSTIEKHYKYPQDIEWTYEKNKFYIVQSRPITTL